MLEYPVIIDWITFSGHAKSFSEIISFLGMQEYIDSFSPCNGHNFFKLGMFFTTSDKKDITINFQQRSDPELFSVDISGRGCRDIESFSSYDLDLILHRINQFDGFKISRIDIAMDVIDKNFKIKTLVNASEKFNYTCRSDFRNIMNSYNKGITAYSLYFGRKESNIFVNIYDKRAERGYTPEEMPDDWTRIEIRLRHENAEGFLKKYVKADNDIGYLFVGVLNNYLRFLKPGKDTNKSRWETAPYWKKLLHHAEKVKVFYKPGVEYDYSKFEESFFQSCGSRIITYLKFHTSYELERELSLRSVKPNARQQFLIDNYDENSDYKLI